MEKDDTEYQFADLHLHTDKKDYKNGADQKYRDKDYKNRHGVHPVLII